jgi:hypothetical protein
LDTTSKPDPYPWVSWRFESIIHLASDKTWQHETHEPHRHHEWPKLVTTIKESSRAHHTLVQVFHTLPHQVYVGGPHTIPKSPMKYGGVSSNLATVEATKLAGPHKSRMCQYIINACCNRAQPTGSLTDISGGYNLGAPNLISDHSQPYHLVFSTPPCWPRPVSHRATNSIANINHIEPPYEEYAFGACLVQGKG